MTITRISEKFSTLGLPRNWQLYIVMHIILSLSLMFMSNDFLLNVSNILLTNMVLFGVLVGFYKYHKGKFLQWGGFVIGVAAIALSVTLQSLIYFGMENTPTTNSSIEQVGIILLSYFRFSFMLRVEKAYKLHGFTINYSLAVISLLLFIFLVSPNLLNSFLYELDFTQQINISNFIFSIIFLFIVIINQFLCKTLLITDIIRIIMILFLGTHFGLATLEDFLNTSGDNTFISRATWSFYQLAGTLAIVYIFVERFFIDYHQPTATRMTNTFMWSASILAIIVIPLGLIVRDRLGLPPISALITGIASFLLSSIVIWRLQKLISDISQQREVLKTIAYIDPLTGLYNYHGYLEELSNKSIEDLFVVALNVEDFKSINDLHGREFGDEVLKSLAQRLNKTPGIILAARTSSDYFQAVFKTSSSNIPRTIDKIQNHLGIWDIVNKRRIAVPITYGASYSSKLIKPEILARQAEQALKSSRSEHTNFTLFSEISKKSSYLSKSLPRHELREILQKAVDDDYLPIHFQPIYDLRGGNLKALELLIRVESEEHGLLLPGQFLEQAKAYGLLTSLTQVCINMVAKCYEQLPKVTININVPPYMLKNLQVLNEFITCFEKAKLPMSNFCIEVTEDGDIPTDHLIPAIKLLKSQGFKIAMDDFGTGYSSLSRLSVLPVDVVKIDRSLLLAASEGNKSILESAISLTKRLGATTVVEGVETLEQLSLIKRLGADSVQGFLLSRPVKISKATLLSLNAHDIIPEF